MLHWISWTKFWITFLANASVLSVLALSTAAFAAPAHTPGTSGYCYQWPTETITAGWTESGLYHTDQIMVTDGSPCLDINVHAVHSVYNQPMCATLRVRLDGVATPWRRVCQGWQVLKFAAPEGRPFTIEAQQLARVGVRA